MRRRVSQRSGTRCFVLVLIVLGASLGSGAAVDAQNFALRLTGMTANVAGADRPVRIDLLRWSSPQERNAVATAWLAPDEADAVAGGGNGRGGRGGFGGFGGGGRGGEASEPEPVTPIEAVTATIEQAGTLGYIWTDGAAGFSLKYAVETPLADGGRRIVVATNRRLDEHSSAWTPTGEAQSSDYAFTLIEVRLDAAGNGEARSSLTGEIEFEADGASLVLGNFDDAAVLFTDVQ